ncbi:bifunctional metallophosphatase/5'-nucleotidase [Lysinibacillus sp. LZ02]|uniref:bifunctional metallophosphatase/5'-nucleotidase n=1 Tax=Lysinibacillus sp. LZ02 TaxID=3420668 RepID=UPI003D36CD4F
MITICVTSDVHGRLDRFEQIAKEIEHIQPDILIDNGDFLIGSLTTYYYDWIQPTPHPMLALANKLGYDVAIFGNHEFNYPISSIQEMRNQCHFSWIAGNIGDFAKPYILKYVKGKKVAIVGVVTHFTPLWDEQHYTQELTFSNAYSAARYWVHYVKEMEQADIVILSYHGGFTRDPETNWLYAAETGENEANQMLTIPGVDVLITGHQHLEIHTIVNGIPVLQPGANGHCFGMIHYDIEGHQHQVQLHYVEDLSASYPAPIRNWLSETIGYTEEDFTYEGYLSSQLHNIPYVDLLHEIQLSTTGADLSVVELFYQETGGFTGAITNEDILKNYSRSNTLKVLQLTGADIKEALEQCAAVFAVNAHDEIDFSLNVYPNTIQPYVYDFWGGLDYELSITKPVGERVTKFAYKGQQVTRDMTFKVAMNSYRATGAEFPMFREKTVLFETTEIVPEITRNFVKQHSPLPLYTHGTFQVTY